MTPFLRAIHQHAAQRGDGLRTEFVKHFFREPARFHHGAHGRPASANRNEKPSGGCPYCGDPHLLL